MGEYIGRQQSATAHLSATQIPVNSSFRIEHTCPLPKEDIAIPHMITTSSLKLHGGDVSPLHQDRVGNPYHLSLVFPLCKRHGWNWNKITTIQTHIPQREAQHTAVTGSQRLPNPARQ